MGLEIATTQKKCNLCKLRRSQRYCLRYGKDICWVCCNNKRIDRDCPSECSYKIQEDESQSLQSLKAKFDSYREQINLHSLAIDYWAELPEKYLDNKIPAELVETEEGRSILESYIKKIPLVHPQTLTYLRKKLKLPHKEILYSHYEDTAMNYLDLIIEQEWGKTIDLMSDNKRYEEDLYRSNYLKRRSENRLLKKLTTYHLILSAISEKKDEALTYFEINGKQDLTINLVREGQKWKVKFLILGSPQLYYGITQIENEIIGPLSKNKLDEARSLLNKYSGILIDSPEIFYLYGLYYSMLEDYAKARDMFLNCVEINPHLYDYKYNFAFTSQASGNPSIAKDIYLELLEEKPDDLKTLNNMAVIKLNGKDIKGAIKIWEKCLTIDSNFELAKKNIERFKYAKPSDLEPNNK